MKATNSSPRSRYSGRHPPVIRNNFAHRACQGRLWTRSTKNPSTQCIAIAIRLILITVFDKDFNVLFSLLIVIYFFRSTRSVIGWPVSIMDVVRGVLQEGRLGSNGFPSCTWCSSFFFHTRSITPSLDRPENLHAFKSISSPHIRVFTSSLVRVRGVNGFCDGRIDIFLAIADPGLLRGVNHLRHEITGRSQSGASSSKYQEADDTVCSPVCHGG